MAELVRTSGGAVIHRATCRYATQHVHPWEWAEGRAYVEIRLCARRLRYKLCKVCKPGQGAGIVGGSVDV